MYQSLRVMNCVAILEVFVAGFDILPSFSSTASCIVVSHVEVAPYRRPQHQRPTLRSCDL